MYIQQKLFKGLGIFLYICIAFSFLCFTEVYGNEYTSIKAYSLIESWNTGDEDDYFTKDGKYFVSHHTRSYASPYNSVVIRSAPEFEEVKKFTGRDDNLYKVYFSPDEKFLIFIDTYLEVIVFNVPEFSEVARFYMVGKPQSAKHFSFDIAFSLDNKYCVIYKRSEYIPKAAILRICKTTDFKDLKETLKFSKKQDSFLGFSSDSKFLYLYGKEKLKIIHLTTFKLVEEIKTKRFKSSSETNFVCLGKKDIEIRQAPEFKLINKIKVDPKRLAGYLFWKDKYLVLYEIKPGDYRLEHEHYLRIMRIPDFEEIGKLIIGTLKDEEYIKIAPYKQYEQAPIITDIANIFLSSDGKYLALNYNMYTKVYTMPFLEKPKIIKGVYRGFSPTFKYLMGYNEKGVVDKFYRLSDSTVIKLSAGGTLSPNDNIMASIGRGKLGVGYPIYLRYATDSYNNKFNLANINIDRVHRFIFSNDCRFLAAINTFDGKTVILRVPPTPAKFGELLSISKYENAVTKLRAIKDKQPLWALMELDELSMAIDVFKEKGDSLLLKEAQSLRDKLTAKIPDYKLGGSPSDWYHFANNALMSSEGKAQVSYRYSDKYIFLSSISFQAIGYAYEIQIIEDIIDSFLKLATNTKLSYSDFSVLYNKLGMQETMSELRKGYSLNFSRTGNFVYFNITRADKK